MAEICIICGLVGFVSTLITLVLGLRIIAKYIKFKETNLLYIGLSYVLLWSAWWPASISFIMYLITQDGLPFVAYIFLGNFFLPFALLFWMMAMLNLLNVEESTKKIGLIICTIYLIAFDILVIYYLLNPSELGYLRNPLVPIYNIGFYLWILPLIIGVAITGIIFALESFKSDNKVTILKGKFLLISFITVVIGVLLEIFLTGDFNLQISRVIIVIGLLLMYLGFMMPTKLKDIFIKS